MTAAPTPAARPMLLEFGGYLSLTPPISVATINIARQDYRQRRRWGLPRHQARHAAAAFVLFAVSTEARPTRRHQAWLNSISKAAA